MRIVFDIETDGLDATKIWCLSYHDIDTDKGDTLTDHQEMKDLLAKCTMLIGHNIVRYDIPVLERLLSITVGCTIVDTLALSWYLYPKRKRGTHGLAAWGDQLGVAKPHIEDWENQTLEEYMYRCASDVQINLRLWDKQERYLLKIYNDESSYMRLARYLSNKLERFRSSEEHPFRLDIRSALASIEKLEKEIKIMKIGLKRSMPTVKIYKTVNNPKDKVFKKTGGLSVRGEKWFELCILHGKNPIKDSITFVDKEEEPNPDSTVQVKEWLEGLGWIPETFNYVRDKDTNKTRKVPQIKKEGSLCPSVKKLLKVNPDIKYLEKLKIYEHRKNILKRFISDQKDGYIAADIAGFTNTLRARHKTLVNLPGVYHHKEGERLLEDGYWIRKCLVARPGHKICGSDMSSLEDTTKRHYIYPYDKEYVEEMMVEGYDPHLELAKFAGALTQQQVDAHKDKTQDHSDVRYLYKTANYSCTYGVGAAKMALTLDIPEDHAKSIIDAFWDKNWAVKKFAEDCMTKTIGQQMWVYNPVSGFWYSLRYEKDIFSTVNQGTGSYCFDLWLKCIKDRYPEISGQFHDEGIWQIPIDKEQDFEKILQDSIQEVNDKLKLNVELKVDIQFGDTYADVH